MTTGKNIALTRQTSVSKVMPLLFIFLFFLYLCSFYFDIISNLQKYFKNNTKNSYFVYILPIFSVICSLHVHARILFSEPFVNKFQTLCSFTPKHFSVYFFKSYFIHFYLLEANYFTIL